MDAAAKESQEGEITGFVFIILEIPNLLSLGTGDVPDPKRPRSGAGSR
jgi:hypothetical protein